MLKNPLFKYMQPGNLRNINIVMQHNIRTNHNTTLITKALDKWLVSTPLAKLTHRISHVTWIICNLILPARVRTRCVVKGHFQDKFHFLVSIFNSFLLLCSRKGKNSFESVSPIIYSSDISGPPAGSNQLGTSWYRLVRRAEVWEAWWIRGHQYILSHNQCQVQNQMQCSLYGTDDPKMCLISIRE